MVNTMEKSLDDEVHNLSSYLNNVNILQDGCHSEPLFEKMTFRKQISENGEITFVFSQILSTPIYCRTHDSYPFINQTLI